MPLVMLVQVSPVSVLLKTPPDAPVTAAYSTFEFNGSPTISLSDVKFGKPCAPLEISVQLAPESVLRNSPFPKPESCTAQLLSAAASNIAPRAATLVISSPPRFAAAVPNCDHVAPPSVVRNTPLNGVSCSR